MVNQQPSELFPTINGKMLFAVAWEDWGKHAQAGVFYLHAFDTGHARAILVRNFQRIGRYTRVISVAPALGGYVKEDKKTRVYIT